MSSADLGLLGGQTKGEAEQSGRTKISVVLKDSAIN